MTTTDLNKVISNKAYDCVTAYIDAAFGSHIDGKSHTGATICLGNTSVIELSRKQRIVTKDFKEAELFALLDILCETKLYLRRRKKRKNGFEATKNKNGENDKNSGTGNENMATASSFMFKSSLPWPKHD